MNVVPEAQVRVLKDGLIGIRVFGDIFQPEDIVVSRDAVALKGAAVPQHGNSVALRARLRGELGLGLFQHNLGVVRKNKIRRYTASFMSPYS